MPFLWVLKPEWSYRKILVGWLILVLIMTFSGGIWKYYSTFVSMGGCIYAPIVAVFLADFFLVRRQRFSLRGLIVWKIPMNIPEALISWL